MKKRMVVFTLVLFGLFLTGLAFAQDETANPADQTVGPAVEQPAGDAGGAPSGNVDQGAAQGQEGTTSEAPDPR